MASGASAGDSPGSGETRGIGQGRSGLGGATVVSPAIAGAVHSASARARKRASVRTDTSVLFQAIEGALDLLQGDASARLQIVRVGRFPVWIASRRVGCRRPLIRQGGESRGGRFVIGITASRWRKAKQRIDLPGGIGEQGRIARGFGGGLPTKRYLLSLEKRIADGDLFGTELFRQ